MATLDTETMLRLERRCLFGNKDWRSAAALCLSGGGIRSASFCLGVLQVLAQRGLLRQFHYLSTVSGGGYIGGWLQQVLLQAPPTATDRVAWAQEQIARPDYNALSRLRDNTNYLTPRTGPGSPDTWAGVALYLRNTLVNWLVFLPVFLAAALAPVFHRTLTWAAGECGWAILLFGAAAFLLLGSSVYVACRSVPSQRPTPVAAIETAEERRDRSRRLALITGCALGWAGLAPIPLQYLLGKGWLAWVHVKPIAVGTPVAEPATPVEMMPMSAADLLHSFVGNFGMPVLFLLTLLIAFGLAWLRQPEHSARTLFERNWPYWGLAALLSASVFALLLAALFAMRPLILHPEVAAKVNQVNVPVTDLRADTLTLGAPLVLLVLHLAQVSVYLGWRREARVADLDREWLARINGITLALGLTWTVFAVSCVLPSRLVTLPEGSASHLGLTFTGLSALASGFASSWIGKQVISRVGGGALGSGLRGLVGVAQVVLPVIFVVALAAFLSAILQDVLGMVADAIYPPLRPVGEPCSLPVAPGFDPSRASAYCPMVAPPDGQPADGLDPELKLLPLGLQVVLFGLLALWVWFLRGVVNVNRFSLHAVYRNRLVRAFLGTPRDPATRRPDAFTGLDETDNPRLASLPLTGCLFPVINMTMNITSGARGAWAERKGASFTATPLYCGSADLRARSGSLFDPAPGAYVRTKRFGGMETPADQEGRNKGLHLGSAMTISGAAASPNWGYHSSPTIAFLMTLFNVRLGAWYANPAIASARDIQLAKPPNALLALLDELSGIARADRQAVYLSDGGHFDNLGVYEMLRRRCQLILVIDAGQDEETKLFDLGMAIRKAEIDLRVSIDLPIRGVASRAAIKAGARDVDGFAYGRIRYFDDQGGEEGCAEIIYLKPTLLADVPTAVRAFANENDSFPHETTLDQFFSESQFESYRSLGMFQAKRLLRGIGTGIDPTLERLFTSIRLRPEGNARS